MMILSENQTLKQGLMYLPLKHMYSLLVFMFESYNYGIEH